MGDDGIPIKNRQPLDYRTEKQWEDAGRKVIDQSAGVEMHPTRRSRKTCIYYLIENTKLINKEGEEGEGNYCP